MRIPTHNPFNHSIRNAGFTLVELLMVVLVLGILATIGVGRLRDVSLDSQIASLRTTLAGMGDAIEMNSSGSPPATIEGGWFRSGKLPRHPQNSFGVPALEIENKPNKSDPGSKVLRTGVNGAYWYNPANGSVRARVASQPTASATLDLYNRVNETAYTSTGVLGNFVYAGFTGS